MASVRVFYKKQIRIDRMNFGQQSMFKIGTVGVAAVKNRLAAAGSDRLFREAPHQTVRDPENEAWPRKPP
jgi:hypothetical protein